MNKALNIAILCTLLFTVIFCSYTLGFRSGEDYMFGGTNYTTINGSMPRDITNFWIK